MERFLTPIARADLLKQHRRERDGRVKDRIKVILWRDDGWSYASIAEALFLSEEGVRRQLMNYFESNGKKIRPENGGSESFLNESQAQELKNHLEGHLYVKVSDICCYGFQIFAVMSKRLMGSVTV